MAKLFLVDLDLNQNELQNGVLQNLAANPATPKAGQQYFNTTTNKFRVFNGTTWDEMGTGGGTVTSVGIANSANGGMTITGSPITTNGTINIGHTNVLANAQTTQAIYPIKIDKNGHISAYGTALGNVSTSDAGLLPAFSSANQSSTKVTSTDYIWDATTNKYQQLPETAFSDTTYTDGTAGFVLKAKQDKDGNQIDTTYAKLASPALTGTPTAPTATAGTNTTQIATTAFVQTAISGVSGAMYFKGTIGTGGTAGTALPTSGVKVGDTYKIITDGTYAGQAAKTGDLFIATATTPTWAYVPSGDDTSVTQITAGAGLNTTSSDTSTDGGSITTTGTLHLTKSGVTAGTYQGLTIDKYGRVTAAQNMNYTSNTGTVTKVTAGKGLTTTSNSSTDGGDITTTGTLYLTKTGVTAGTYNNVTVDAYGRVTAASNYVGLAFKKSFTITGDGSTTNFQLENSSASADLIVQVYDYTSGEEVITDVNVTTSYITIGFAAAPDSTAKYRVVVVY